MCRSEPTAAPPARRAGAAARATPRNHGVHAGGMARAPHDRMRPRSLLSLAGLLTGLALACGGTTSPASQVIVGDDIGPEAGSDARPGDARTEAAPVDASSDGGCITPTVGQPCTQGQTACQPPDPCCAGYEWVCDSTGGTWQQAGLGCACQLMMPDAGPFACGNKTCLDGYYCEAQRARPLLRAGASSRQSLRPTRARRRPPASRATRMRPGT